jgi:cation diffusion facilitator family transporter
MPSTYKQVKRVLSLTLFLNLAVAVAKLLWGHLTNSLSMQADGFHSLFDGASNIIGLVGIWVARHPPDDCHPYGHKKFETFAAFGISVLLFLTCFHILESSYSRVQTPFAPQATFLSFIIMLGAIGINFFVAWWETKKGKEFKSDVLMADAMHTKSDVFGSLSVFISLIATRLGYPILDPVAAVLIAALIGKIGFSILAEASRGSA